MTNAALYMMCLLNSIIIGRKENVLFERLASIGGTLFFDAR